MYSCNRSLHSLYISARLYLPQTQTVYGVAYNYLPLYKNYLINVRDKHHPFLRNEYNYLYYYLLPTNCSYGTNIK